MAANGYQPPLQDTIKGLTAHIKTLTVADLKTLLRSQHIPVSGNKAELQIRIISCEPPITVYTEAARLTPIHSHREERAQPYVAGQISTGSPQRWTHLLQFLHKSDTCFVRFTSVRFNIVQHGRLERLPRFPQHVQDRSYEDHLRLLAILHSDPGLD
jgi:hypothetical protein